MTTIGQISCAQQNRLEIPAGFPGSAVWIPAEHVVSIAKTPLNQAISPFLEGLLQFGVAENGLPIMLNLYDPTPGSLLVAGDTGCGKTTYLQSLTLGSNHQDPGEILFGVVTPFPEEWLELEVLSNCLGIWPAYHSAANHFLSQLVSWTEVLPSTRQLVILLVDGLDLLTTNGSHCLNDLRWLLTYGPRRHVWPIVSTNPGRLPHVETWLEYFQTRILGRIKRLQTADLLMTDPGVNLADLSPVGQYVFRERDHSQKFRVPSGYLNN